MMELKELLNLKTIIGKLISSRKSIGIISITCIAIYYYVDNTKLRAFREVDKREQELNKRELIMSHREEIDRLKDSIKYVQYEEMQLALQDKETEIGRLKASGFRLKSERKKEIDEMVQEIIKIGNIEKPDPHFAAYFVEEQKEYDRYQALVELLEIKVKEYGMYEVYKGFIEKRKFKARTRYTRSTGSKG